MGVRLAVSGDYLSTSNNLINYNSNYTVMGWFYISNTVTSDASFFTLLGNTANYDCVSLGSAGATLDSYVVVGGSYTQSTGTGLVVGQWNHIAAVRSSPTLLTIYLNGVSDQTNTRIITGRSAIANMRVGGWDDSYPLQLDGRVQAMKIWDTDLTSIEIVNEMNTYTPQSQISSLNRFTPLLDGAVERLRDYGPNKTDWTANGTLTDEAPPPLRWGDSATIIPFAAPSPWNLLSALNPPTNGVYNVKRPSDTSGSLQLYYELNGVTPFFSTLNDDTNILDVTEWKT